MFKATTVICSSCNGTGVLGDKSWEESDCRECKKEGFVTLEGRDLMMYYSQINDHIIRMKLNITVDQYILQQMNNLKLFNSFQ